VSLPVQRRRDQLRRRIGKIPFFYDPDEIECLENLISELDDLVENFFVISGYINEVALGKVVLKVRAEINGEDVYAFVNKIDEKGITVFNDEKSFFITWEDVKNKVYIVHVFS
jgi:hypothetical protein